MIYLLYILYAQIHGQTNAFLYSLKGSEALPENEHNWLVKERILAYGFAIAGILETVIFFNIPNLNWYHFIIYQVAQAVCTVLAFSFFHNAAYYVMRDKVDGTKNGPNHTSTTSSAKHTYTYKERVRMAQISLVLMVANIAGVILNVLL